MTMTRTPVSQLARTILADRHFLSVLVLLVLTGIGFVIYDIVHLRPSDLQIVTHYTAFGKTHAYSDKWYYLVSFALFGIMNTVVYIGFACKLYFQKNRSLGLAFGWLGVLMIIVATAILYRLLKLVAL